MVWAGSHGTQKRGSLALGKVVSLRGCDVRVKQLYNGWNHRAGEGQVGQGMQAESNE